MRRAIWDSGSICLALSAFLYSVSVLFAKTVSATVPILQVLFFRSALASIGCAAAGKLRGTHPVFGHPKHFHWLTLRGLVGCSSMVTYYLALTMLPVGDTASLFYFNSPLTALLGWLVLGDPLTWQGFAGCLVSTAGVLVLIQPPFIFKQSAGMWTKQQAVGTVIALACAVITAAAFNIIRCAAASWLLLCTRNGRP